MPDQPAKIIEPLAKFKIIGKLMYLHNKVLIRG